MYEKCSLVNAATGITKFLSTVDRVGAPCDVAWIVEVYNYTKYHLETTVSMDQSATTIQSQDMFRPALFEHRYGI
jgi:hypothetical protein